MNFRLRSNSRMYDPSTNKSQQQQQQAFYYPPRPELKPHYSTSTASNRYASHNLDYTMNGSHYYQLVGSRSSTQQQQRNDYLTSPTSSDANNNPFAPIGYSRQRSTSLLPTIGSHHHHTGHQHHHSHHQQQQQANGSSMSSNSDSMMAKNSGGSSNSFGVYPLYMPPSSRVGINSSTTTNHDYYMMNSRMYPLESKCFLFLTA